MTSELQCYRKGCGKNYDPQDNTASSCLYHPGAPVFHDALKGWSCCDKKSTDFSIFLDMPGCASGFHSNEKPPPMPKSENKLLPPETVIKGPLPKSADRSGRPDSTAPKTILNSSIGATLKQALEKRMANLTVANNSPSDPVTGDTDGNIKLGTACKNNTCKAHYQGPESIREECFYHPGVPIFHEGMKYWSCCEKKTPEFDKFMDQLGCENGLHKWVATAKDTANMTKCRMDWHQTSSNVIISVFSKCADPTKTVVKANQVSVDIYIVYEDEKVFTDTFELNGVIDVEKSSVKLLGAKVEITLKKGEPESWAQLQYKPPATESEEAK